MPENTVENLLARLAGRGSDSAADLYATVAATQPDHNTPKAAAVQQGERLRQDKLDELLGRIAQLTGGATAATNPTAVGAATNGAAEPAAVTAPVVPIAPVNEFFPAEPASFFHAKLSESEVEDLTLKFLLAHGDASGRDVADQLKLPFLPLEELLRQLKQEQWIVHRGAAAMNDYQYQLTDKGRERARRLAEHCTYFGSAPVALSEYIASVAAQSLTMQHPTSDDLRRAFEDLLINPRMLGRLGPAINSGRGLFLYGAAGNGKTSIAERVTRAFGQFIWIPRAIGVDGEIIRLFDPSNHEEAPLESTGGLLDNRKIDKRWIRIRRPTIVVGGELTMDNLEVIRNTSTGICEAPMQMKSNCGTLVIDDFGRQRMSTDELLNRWIVAAREAAGLPQPAERQKAASAVRSAHHLLDEPSAARLGRRSVSPANSLQDRRRRSDGRRVPPVIQDDGAETWTDLSRGADRLFDQDALRRGGPPVPQLPAARPLDASAQSLLLRKPPARTHLRAFRHGGRELLCDDVTKS